MAEDRTAAIRARLDRPAKTPLVHLNSLLEACSLRVRMRGDTFEVQYPNETAKARADLIANAPADIAFLLDENDRLRRIEAAARVVDVAWRDGHVQTDTVGRHAHNDPWDALDQRKPKEDTGC